MPRLYYNIYVGMVVYKPKTQQILDSCLYNLEIRVQALNSHLRQANLS